MQDSCQMIDDGDPIRETEQNDHLFKLLSHHILLENQFGPKDNKRGKMKHSTATPPSNYICPFTLEIMREPVLSRWGHTYERVAIMKWLRNHDRCPLTRQPLRPSTLITNAHLKKEICEWKREHGYTHLNDETSPPEEFLCPLTQEIMVHPVTSRWGDTYERAAIIDWFNRGYSFCPVSGEPLRPSYLFNNSSLARRIQNWKKETDCESESDDDQLSKNGEEEVTSWLA
jgi:hypothetical protein